MRNDIFKHKTEGSGAAAVRVADGAMISTYSLTRDEKLDPKKEDTDLVKKLIDHLNEFVEHYHQVIWWRMDPNRRFMLLDGIIAPHSKGKSVASVVENRLISIVGNSLVMPVVPGYQLDPTICPPVPEEADEEKGRKVEEEEPINLLEMYQPGPAPPKRISLPTRGVHAEAILGACNSCEVRDDKYFWNWAAEPIPNNEPTEISEVSTASLYQAAPDTTPDELPTPVVAIQNAPAAPDPTSITDIANLLGKENLFRDVSGLAGTQAGALGACLLYTSDAADE